MKATPWFLSLLLLLAGCEMDELDPAGQADGNGALGAQEVTTAGADQAAGGSDAQGAVAAGGPGANGLSSGSPGAANGATGAGSGPGVANGAAGGVGAVGPEDLPQQGPKGTFYGPPPVGSAFPTGTSGAIGSQQPGSTGSAVLPPGTQASAVPSPGASLKPSIVPSKAPVATPTPYIKPPRTDIRYVTTPFVNFVTDEVYGQKPYVQPVMSWPMALKKGPLAVKIEARVVDNRSFSGPHRLELHRVNEFYETQESTVLIDWLGACKQFVVSPGVKTTVPNELLQPNSNYVQFSGQSTWVAGPRTFPLSCNQSDSPAKSLVEVEIPRDGVYRLVSIATNSIFVISCQQESIAVMPTPTGSGTGSR